MLCTKAKTRLLVSACNGSLRKPSPQICRSGAIDELELVCQKHCDQIRRKDEKKCSCPSTWGHSPKIHPHPIPQKYYEILDEVGRDLELYSPGTRWCHKCKKNAPERLANWPKVASKRKKVNLKSSS